MLSKKLITFFQTFTTAEHKQFRKYLTSPFFNENKTLIQLYDAIAYGLAKNKLPNKENLWKKLKANQAYNDTRFRKYCSELTQHGERFLAYRQFEESPEMEKNYLLQALNTRQLDKHFSATERAARKLQSHAKYQDIDYHLSNFLLENEIEQFQIRRIQRTSKIGLEQFDQSLDHFYLAQKLKNYCNALNYKNIINKDFEIGFIEVLLRELAGRITTYPPAIQVYYQVMLTLSEQEDEAVFYQLRALLKQFGDLFPQPELRELYIFAQNYCIKRINTGKREYFRELYGIYDTLLEKGTIFNRGELLPWDLKNMVAVGLRIGEFDWLEKIIHTHSHRLPEGFRANAITYNLAMVHFHKKEYQKVIELLREVEYQDLFYALDGKWLLIKTYYELDELEAMEALLESFRIFLLRHRLIAKTKQRQYLNLIRFVKKMNRLQWNNESAVEKLRKKIEDAADVADRVWLLEKIKQ